MSKSLKWVIAFALGIVVGWLASPNTSDRGRDLAELGEVPPIVVKAIPVPLALDAGGSMCGTRRLAEPDAAAPWPVVSF